MGQDLPRAPKLWRSAWEQFIPFLDYDLEIRRVLCSTNAIESLNAGYRRAVNAKGHFPPSRQCSRRSDLLTRFLDPKGLGQARWVTPVEARPQRVRHHLLRPHARGGEPLEEMPVAPGIGQTLARRPSPQDRRHRAVVRDDALPSPRRVKSNPSGVPIGQASPASRRGK